MLKIRLQKVGKKNAPSYRVVLSEHTSKPQGKFIEILGFYNPRLKEKSFKKERIEHWIDKGAQPSLTVHNLLIDAKIIEGEKLRAWKAKKKQKKPKETPKETESSQETKSVDEASPKPEVETPEPEIKESEQEKSEKPKPEPQPKAEKTEDVKEEVKEEKKKEEAPKEAKKEEEALDKTEKID